MALSEYHGFADSVRWRLVPEGVQIEGTGVERSKGRPASVTRVWKDYEPAIDEASRNHRVPVELIIATICTESGGHPDAVRLEPGYASDERTPNKVSVGLTQTLISTARDTMRLSLGRDWLLVPGNAITAGTAYMALQARQTALDPPLVAAAYNAGRLAHQTGARNRWKLRQYPMGTGEHVDRFVRFVNDAVAMLAEHGARPSLTLASLLGDSPPRPSVPAPAAEPDVRWGAQARREAVPAYALTVLREIAGTARLSSLLVTSTQRTPEDQARIMYDNCEHAGVPAQKKLYGRYGDQVVDVYAAGKAAGHSPDRIRGAMRDKIVEVGASNVSRHTADPGRLAVLDIAPGSIHDRAAFERAVRADSRVSHFLQPPDDPAYHLEIPLQR
ncbi:transglycosylase SLT domain-containing protein [Streptomyces sp. PA03-1a]|nr:transglycosylase SLT domain-containing protein [Streptomyces sp. PA03-1a]MDX2817127.1 transglycosylase SLT domain-containing protein [Streptomyces sp. PA03-5A]